MAAVLKDIAARMCQEITALQTYILPAMTRKQVLRDAPEWLWASPYYMDPHGEWGSYGNLGTAVLMCMDDDRQIAVIGRNREELALLHAAAIDSPAFTAGRDSWSPELHGVWWFLNIRKNGGESVKKRNAEPFNEVGILASFLALDLRNSPMKDAMVKASWRVLSEKGNADTKMRHLFQILREPAMPSRDGEALKLAAVSSSWQNFSTDVRSARINEAFKHALAARFDEAVASSSFKTLEAQDITLWLDIVVNAPESREAFAGLIELVSVKARAMLSQPDRAGIYDKALNRVYDTIDRKGVSGFVSACLYAIYLMALANAENNEWGLKERKASRKHESDQVHEAKKQKGETLAINQADSLKKQLKARAEAWREKGFEETRSLKTR